MERRFFHWTEPSSSATFPPLAPTSPDLVSLVTQRNGTLPSRAAPPWQWGAMTQPEPLEGSAQALRSQASVNKGLSVNFWGETHLGFGSPAHGFLWPPL